MQRAFSIIRPNIPERIDAVISGLQKLGYSAKQTMLRNGSIEGLDRARCGDILVSWNRGGRFTRICDQFENQGGTVLIMENGYLSPPDETYYALAIHGHNGSGTWFVNGPERWERLGIEMMPWRKDGDHVLVCLQRSIGSPEMRMPNGWSEKIVACLRKATKRKVVVRRHPGNEKRPVHTVPLSHDLKNAWCVVTWSSGAANEALIHGIPCFYCAPHHVSAKAMKRGIDDIEKPFTGDRLPAMIDLSWAQWTLDEIRNGKAFDTLLNS